jgi:hypothetical protein
MSTIAFAATDSNTIGADAGITISDHDPEGDVHTDMAFEVAPLPEDEDGWLDEDAADALLARMGYSKVSPWTRSGGQWAAEVEHA